MSTLLSIILPVANQADHVEWILDEYRRNLSALPCRIELIVVVNASHDDSLAICERLAVADPRIKVFNLEEGGWGRAVRAGLSLARGDLIGYTNSARTRGGDLAHLSSLALANSGHVVKGKRILRDKLTRRIGSFMYNLECRSLLGCRSRDVNGTPKFFPRAFGPLMSLKRDDDLIDAEFMSLCRRHTYPVIEWPVTATKRHGGRSTTGYRSALRMYRGVVELRRSLKDDRSSTPEIVKP